MPDYHGQFCWYDLMTSDQPAAKAFYGAVLGWGSMEAGGTPPYTLWTLDGDNVGGLMALPKEAADMGLPPSWMGYVAVDDCDAYAAKVVEAGGAIHRPPTDIPEVGRFAVVADPQGAVFILMRPLRDDSPARPGPEALGYVGWRELMAGDAPAVFDFYGKLFGWKKDQAFDMGPMGVYQLFATRADPVGGMMTSPPGAPWPPHWQYYFNVGDIDAAKARVEAGGGKVLMGPEQVPTGQWILQVTDPQGALFGLLGSRK
jgi:predicted enzyme related to lactoylglutathione lyase